MAVQEQRQVVAVVSDPSNIGVPTRNPHDPEMLS